MLYVIHVCLVIEKAQLVNNNLSNPLQHTGSSNCYDEKNWGKCWDDYMINPTDPDVQALGSYCAATCGRCNQGEFLCADRAPPGSLSGVSSLEKMRFFHGSLAHFYHGSLAFDLANVS